MDSEIIDLMSFVQISEYRVKILKILGKEMKFPSQIAKELDLRTNEVSRLLMGLREKNLIEVLNPEAELGRYYQLTDKGKEVLKHI